MSNADWIRRIGAHGAAQASAQLAGLLTGILIVRALDKTEYAQYSLISALLPAIASLADSGIGSVLLSKGQALRAKPRELDGLLRAAFRERWLLAAPTIALSLMWLCLTLLSTGADAIRTASLLSVTALILFPSLTIGLLQVFQRIHMDARTLRRAILIPSLLRLGLTFFAVATSFSSIWILLAINLIAACWTVLYLSRHNRSPQRADYRPKDVALRSEFRRAIRKSLPLTLSALVTSQAVLGLIAMKGSAEILAEFSAVSRYGLAFSLFLPIVADLAAPAIARLPAVRALLIKKIAFTALLCVTIVVMGVASVWLLREPLLFLLGPGYSQLGTTLTLVFLGYGLTFLGHSMSAVAQSRNWLDGSWSYVPLAAAWILWAATLPSIRNAEEAALLFLAQSVLLILAQLVRIGIGLTRTKGLSK